VNTYHINDKITAYHFNRNAHYTSVLYKIYMVPYFYLNRIGRVLGIRVVQTRISWTVEAGGL